MSGSALASLKNARDNYAARLEEISANPQLTYSEAGITYSWTEYQRFLLEAIKSLEQQILYYEGPGEDETFAVV